MIAFYVIFTTTMVAIITAIVKGRSDKHLLSHDTTDTCKGIAIICIILHHFTQYFPIPSPLSVFFGLSGFCWTGVFFALSGYGNALSIQKIKTVKNAFIWLANRFLSLYTSYLICYITLSVYFAAIGRYSEINIVTDLLTMGLPGLTNWFPPVMMSLYFVIFIDKLISILLSKDSTGFYFTCLSVLVCVCVCSFGFKATSFWWNSLICFPLGCLVANEKKYIRNKITVGGGIASIFISLILAAVCFIASRKIHTCFEAFSCLFANMSVMLTLLLIPLRSVLLNFIGKISYGLYLFHLVGLVISKNTFYNENIEMIIIFVLSVVVSYPVITLTKRVHVKEI